MQWKARHLAWAALWLLAVTGVLSLGTLRDDLGHSLCGPWGCSAPPQALLAMHGFWLLLLLPPAVWLIATRSAVTVRAVGLACLLAGGLTVGVVFLRDYLTWLPSVPPEWRHYLPQRLLFSVATATDFPMVQVALAGLICWLAGRRRLRRGLRKSLPNGSLDSPRSATALNGSPDGLAGI